MSKTNVRSSVFASLQKVGRSFMFPIALLPVAGLLLGIGSSFTNEINLQTYGLMGIMGPGTILYNIFLLCNDVGHIIFNNLALLFAMGITIGLAKSEKAVACLSAAVSFIALHQTMNTLLKVTGQIVNDGYGHWVPTEKMLTGSTDVVLGITSLQMGVFGGILVGIIVGYLHNRFYKIQLPSVISFFGGVRFVPIICVISCIPLGVLSFFLWPYVQAGIFSLGSVVNSTGYIGTFIFGFIQRALIPFGLHHVFYMPFWQTGLGGTEVIQGVTVQGAQNIIFAQLADPSTTHFSVEAARFMEGGFPFMMFGLPGAALAMYHCAKDVKKKAASGILLSASVTAILTGITEPIEFSFLFAAPFLYYGVHCVLAGLSYMLMHILNVAVGITFSTGLIDLALFGILQGNSKTNWLYIPLVGIFYFFIYYFVFKFLILKKDYKTPGRGEDSSQNVTLYTRKDVERKANEKIEKERQRGIQVDEKTLAIISALGGVDNIIEIDSCATRLRTTVNDSNKVDEEGLKQTGAAGVVRKGQAIQVIYGPKVSIIKSNIEEYLESLKQFT